MSSTGSSLSPHDGSPDSLHGKLICDKPVALRGKVMTDSDLPSFCTSPAILKLAIQVS